MSEKRDREAALVAYWGAERAGRLLATDSFWRRWLDEGAMAGVTDAQLTCLRVADAIAQAREEGRREAKNAIAAHLDSRLGCLGLDGSMSAQECVEMLRTLQALL